MASPHSQTSTQAHSSGPPSSDILKELDQLKLSSPNFSCQLNAILDRPAYNQSVRGIEGNELIWLVRYLDQVIDHLDDPYSGVSQKCLSELWRIEVEQFELMNDGEASRVPAHRFRGALFGEVVLWKHLKHQNITPLLLLLKYMQHQIISPIPYPIINVNFLLPLKNDWTLPEYIEEHPEADRVALLSDVARGLNYLHSYDVVHTELKGRNVLMDGANCARVTNYGLALISPRVRLTEDQGWVRESPKWTAPEVLNGGSYSEASDIFSFGMLMVEVFTGNPPFPGLRYHEVVSAISEGKRPIRPADPALTEPLWELMQKCWNEDPQSRPTVEEVLLVLDPSSSATIDQTEETNSYSL